ncbi:adenosylcobinamide-GDP ribazoletransferase [Paenibacillus sp. OV219]|uniref:adenosylcobinamide-GDP ribazoletransferase n=1 Tax=Paenibacillus sp. OV219 TaxID=1884377 RepID=UPI0008C61C98|nr:adenosylcobinamide-GDP ribazoletransferase [Paenibacillus sp. OV219]SEN36074.1 cobalamin-5'-phosphate synthase [Paenibacillus sp. OV219]
MVTKFMKDQLHAAGTAFQLLTRIPIPAALPFTPQVLATSVAYYPLAGLVIGSIVAALTWVLDGLVPSMPAAVIVLIAMTALSGGLHVDGFMDTADGVLSNRPRERMLEIMKDSRVGAMGVLAAVLLFLFKFSALYTLLAERPDWKAVAPLLALAFGWSRLWIVAAMVLWPFARPNEGMASLFKEVRLRHAAAALAVQLVIVCGVVVIFESAVDGIWLTLLVEALVMAALGSIVCIWLSRKLGGLTGDTYGAVSEIIEAALIFVVMMMVS